MYFVGFKIFWFKAIWMNTLYCRYENAQIQVYITHSGHETRLSFVIYFPYDSVSVWNVNRLLFVQEKIIYIYYPASVVNPQTQIEQVGWFLWLRIKHLWREISIVLCGVGYNTQWHLSFEIVYSASCLKTSNVHLYSS